MNSRSGDGDRGETAVVAVRVPEWARWAAVLVGLIHLTLGAWTALLPTLLKNAQTSVMANSSQARNLGVTEMGVGLLAMLCATGPRGNRALMTVVGCTELLRSLTAVFANDTAASAALSVLAFVFLAAASFAAATYMQLPDRLGQP